MAAPPRPSARAYPGWLGPAAAWLALAIPLGLTLARLGVSTQWRDDLALVRGLGMVPVGGEGVLSAVLVQLAALLPVGGRLMRAALVSAIGLAVSSRLVYALVRRVLRSVGVGSWVEPALALAAALMVSLAPTWQLEGTIAGGATLAVALVLTALLLRPRSDTSDARVWLGYGALGALTALESHAAGAALLLGLIVQAVAVGDVPTRRSVALMLAGAAVAAALGVVPMLVRPHASHVFVDLGYDLVGTGVTTLDTAAAGPGALAAWSAELGIVALCLAVLGALWGVGRRASRWLLVPLVAFVGADLALPASRVGVLASHPLTPVRLLAVVALATAAALGVHAVVRTLGRARIPFARLAAALVVVFDFTLIVLLCEDSAYVADRRAHHGAEVWTDEALRALPPRSLVLVRSEAVAWRLWASRVVRGERPDVVVVPLPLLERGTVAARLLALEPALGHLVREVRINGAPNEYALSTLADVRPLYLEFDPSWDQRLVDHLSPEPLWLRFHPHALGRSDREPGWRRSRAALARVLEVAATPEHRDEATLAVLAARAQEQSAVLAALGDRQEVEGLLADLRSIRPDDPFVEEAEARLRQRRRGRVELHGLLQ